VCLSALAYFAISRGRNSRQSPHNVWKAHTRT
jgi:hypothetical protein